MPSGARTVQHFSSATRRTFQPPFAGTAPPLAQVAGTRLVGGCIDLIPHQLYIAQEGANRHAPRVLLSDEVGLGKTIEACLILHRLLLSVRVYRATQSPRG